MLFFVGKDVVGQEYPEYSDRIYWASIPDSIYIRIAIELNNQFEELKVKNLVNKQIEKQIFLREIHKTRDNLPERFKSILELEQLVENHPDSALAKKHRINVLGDLAYVYAENEEYEKGIDVYERTIDYIEKPPKGSDRDYYLHYAILLTSTDKSNREKSLGILNDMLDLTLEQADTVYSYYIYGFLSALYDDIGEYENSLKYAFKSLEESFSDNHFAFHYANIAESYLKLSKQDSALYYGLLALGYTEKDNVKYEKPIVYSALNTIYGELGNYEEAYKYLTLYNEVSNTERSFSDAIEIGNIVTRKEKEKQRIQDAIAEEQLTNQRKIIVASLIVLALLSGLILYIFKKLNIIQKQNLEIKKQKERIVQSEQFKEQFLANMSHEIRTPMHAISGMLNSLLRSERLKAQEPYLKAMHSSSNNLLVLLNDILDLSKVESGKIQIEQSVIDLKTLIEEVFGLLEYKAKEKNLLLTSSISEQVPAYIMSDRVRLIQILVNLIGNAIKFTEKGSITVSFDYLNSTLIGRVIDTGIGVPDSKKATLFDSYEQGSSLKSELKGTGLGLSITKQLIELQDGKISLESELGKGSTFTFQLPTESITAPLEHNFSLSEEQLKKMGSELAGLKILIGEDNEFNIMVAKDDLEWYIPNIAIQTAKTGNEVVSKFQNESFDLVLMDIQMPELDGYESSKRIRKIENNSSTTPISIIAMSSSLFNSEIEKCYQSGMNGYIPKPYKVNQLLSTIHQIIAEKKPFTS
ncbi:MAG: hypothetical protein BalsKO_07460 [Balneolaceae bacterium]